MFSFFKKRPKTPEQSPTDSTPKDDFEYIENNSNPPPPIPTEANRMYGQPAPPMYPPLNPVYGPHGSHLTRTMSVKQQTATEGVPFKLASHIVGDETFTEVLKSQLDSILRSINQKGDNSSLNYDFQVEKSVISECS